MARVLWIDVAKGVAIFLVVLGHSWDGLENAGMVDPALFRMLHDRIYAFHMPLFFAVSGLFVTQQLARQSVARFTESRIRRLLWPLVVWTYIFLLAKVVAGPLTNAPLQWQDLLTPPIPGYEHLWFLWALFLLHMALLAVKPTLQAAQIPRALLWTVCAASLLLPLTLPLPEPVNTWVSKAVRHAPFFLLGVLIYHLWPSLRLPTHLRISALVGFVVLLSLWPMVEPVAVLKMFGSLALCVMIIFALSNVTSAQGPLVRAPLAMGQASLAIYVMHTIFAAGMREALLAVGIRNLVIHMILGTAIGVIAPMIMEKVFERFQLIGVLGLRR